MLELFYKFCQAPSVAACQKQAKGPCAAAGPPARLAPTCAVLVKCSFSFWNLSSHAAFVNVFCSKRIFWHLWDLNGLDFLS